MIQSKINDSDGEEFEVQDSERHQGVSDANGIVNRGITRARSQLEQTEQPAAELDNTVNADDISQQLLQVNGIMAGGMLDDNRYMTSEAADPEDIKLGMPEQRNSEVKLSQSGQKQQQSNRSKMHRSQSGLDIGQSKAVGSFFSNERQKLTQGQLPNFYSSEYMNGHKFIDRLIKQQEDRYQKRLPFERGQFHQCIPNPQKDGQMITVQLVTRVLDGVGNMTAENHNVFDEDQEHLKNAASESMQFVRYELTPPNAQNDQGDAGEGEGDDDEDEANDSKIMGKQSQRPSVNNLGISARSSHSKSAYGGYKKELYEDLHEPVDVIAGIEPKQYANIGKSSSQRLMNKAQMNSAEYAIVSFWDLDEKTDKFVCSRFFLIPNPMKRIVQDANGTVLYQVLYPSSHTNDVFFFFKGYEIGGGEDLAINANEYVTQCAFVNLMPTEQELDRIGELRYLVNHCHDFVTLTQDGVLQKFIDQMNETTYEDQKMVPNPTVIDTVLYRNVVTAPGKTIVFTAFLQEEHFSKTWPEVQAQNPHAVNKVEECWYPTIFFYDLKQNCTIWEIFGAEQFIQITKKRVTLITNDLWRTVPQQIYDQMVKDAENERKVFSRHSDYYDRIQEVVYMISPTGSELNERADLAPEVLTRSDYRLKFGVNKDLEITEGTKVVEAYLHNTVVPTNPDLGVSQVKTAPKQDKRITLLYQNLGSFTFSLKPSVPLIESSDWLVTYTPEGEQSQSFEWHTMLQFKTNRVEAVGSGVNETGQTMDIKVKLRPDNPSAWEGHFDSEEGLVGLLIEDLDFKYATMTFGAEWSADDVDYSIEGTLGVRQRQTRNKAQALNFVMRAGDVTRVFQGKINPSFSLMSGTYYDEAAPDKSFFFEFKLAHKVKGTLQFLKPGQSPDEAPTFHIEMDYAKRKIKSAQGVARELYIEAVEAVDSAELIYFIKQPDVQFMSNGSEAFVQAKLVATGDHDDSSNGMGVVRSQLILYNVNEIPKNKDKKKQKDRNKKKLVQEPRDRDYIKFFLNQSFLRTQEQKESQLWYVNTSTITSSGRFIGSIIYEEYGSDEQLLNFVTSQVRTDNELDYPQQPVAQSWMVDYPLLAYKTATPMNKEIAIVHMALNMPQRIIHLGNWEFVCFVNHTQMVEQRLFGRQKETNCDIMFLVRYQDKIRLMSFKSNPWLEFREEPSDADEDVFKQSLFLFSGKLNFIPTVDEVTGDAIRPSSEFIRKVSRRFNNDKVQTVQLISQRLAGIEQYMLIIQFNDCIVQASLNSEVFKVICKPEAMVRRHLVRGYNEKIYYAETAGNTEKIQQLEFHSSIPNEITKKEIYQLAGTWLVAFEADPEAIANDYVEENSVQSLYIMDDMQRIYLLKNEDGVRFTVNKTFDFSHHKKLKEINALRDNDWSHVHITERTLSFNDYTYNLNSELSVEITVPALTYGEVKPAGQADEEVDDEENDDGSDDDMEANQKAEQLDWQIQSVQAMSMTANMICSAMRNHKDFCFVVKPAPGSRRVNIVGYQQVSELKQMLFVSNTHVLLKFNGGKAVTLMSNGSIVPQLPRIQRDLEESEVIGESQIYKGKKNVLLEKKYGETQNKTQYICLQFASDGLAGIVGIYDQPQKSCKAQLIKLAMNMYEVLVRSGTLNQSLVEDMNNRSDAVGQSMQQAVGGVLTNALGLNRSEYEKKASKFKIKYAKEFFVTEKGEVIKMAAIVTQDRHILEQLKEQKKQNELQAQPGTKKCKKTGNKQKVFISTFSVANTKENEDPSEGKKTDFKFVVFHCADQKQALQMTRQTQFCVVGNYLCHRVRQARVVWITLLKTEEEDFIPISRLSFEANEQTTEGSYKTYESESLRLTKMVDKKDMNHIQMTEVPKAYFTTQKSITNMNMTFYSNLLQITERNNAMIFDLESKQEVNSIENIDQLQNPDKMVNTGFIMSSSKSEMWEDEMFLRRIQVFTNEYVNLLFEKKQDRYDDGSVEKMISGMLFRTFSEIDLFELKKISNAIQNGQKLLRLDLQTLVSVYEGHTVFSIFQRDVRVYEQILSQLEQSEFPKSENFNGEDVENEFLRSLHRILSIPTADWEDTKQARRRADQERAQSNVCKSCAGWFRMRLGMGDGKKTEGGIGFKSVRQKSLHFQSSRFRESLMEISMMTQENSIIDFVQNLEDIEILFTSMSPATVEFFQNAFNTTRFTNTVKNLDWKLGDTMQVFGGQYSAIDQKVANSLINDDKPKAEESEEIQNRQVVMKMLSLDWVHANYRGYTDVGFRELIVALASAPHESLFSTELVITLIDHFWDYYFKRVFFAGFVPYIIYFICTIIYISNWAVEGIPADQQWELTTEFFMRWIILVSVVYFSFFEFVAMIRDGWNYLFDIFNYFDWSAFILNFYVIITTVWDPVKNIPGKDPASVNGRMLHCVAEDDPAANVATDDKDYSEFMRRRGFAAFLVFIMWVKTFYWVRLFGPTSFYVRLIQETILDIGYFLILFLFILMTFGNTLLIMNAGRDENEAIFADIFGFKFANTIANQYLLSLGEFDVEKYAGAGRDTIIWVVFIATTFITQITFLNMLIAIMGDTFARVSEVKDQSALSEKIKILADYVIVVRKSRLDKDQFLFSISPANLGSDEQSSWEGTVTQLKKAIDSSLKLVQNSFSKKMNAVQAEVSAVNNRLSTIDDRISDLSGSQQMMPNNADIERIMRKVLQEARNGDPEQPEEEDAIPQVHHPQASQEDNYRSIL